MMPCTATATPRNIHGRFTYNCFCLLCSCFIFIQPQAPAAADHLSTDVYLVRFTQPSVVAAYGYNSHRNITAANAYSRELSSDHDRLLASWLKPGSYEKLYSLTNVLNGAVIRLNNPDEVNSLLQKRQVLSIEKDVRMIPQTTYSYKFMQLPNSLWSNVGGPTNAGEGIIIGVIDTGVDPTHPSFSANVNPPYGPVPSSFNGSCVITPDFPAGSCNNKLIAAQYFAAGAIASSIFNQSYDFASPLDGDGHGCHTLSTAGGNSGVPLNFVGTSRANYTSYTASQTVSGAAPRARLAVYKSIFRDGGTLSDTLAALEQAVLDKVNVISMSICPVTPPAGVTYMSALDTAMLAAVQANVVVLQAVGNYGPGAGTAASFSPWIISVGAGTADRTFSISVNLGNGKNVSGLGITGTTSGNRPLIYSADVVTNASAYAPTTCQDPTVLNSSIVAGGILICEYTSDFDFGVALITSVGSTAAALNATGFLLLQTESSITTSFVNPTLYPLPGAFVLSLASSQMVMQYYNNATFRNSTSGAFINTTAVASIGYPTGGPMQFGSKAPVVPSYSGRGPSLGNSDLGLASDVLKPDLIAPGDQIIAAWTSIGIDSPSYAGQSFAVVSGTSMATPHTAGVVALLRQLHPTWSPAAIHSALVTSATNLDNKKATVTVEYPFSNPNSALGAGSPFDFGGGEINPAGATDPGLIFDATFQDYVNFLCSLPWTTPSNVNSVTGGTCNTTTGANPSDLNGPSITIASLKTSRKVMRKATSVGNKTETYTSKITAPSGVSVTITPTNFTIQPNQTLSFVATITVTKATKKFGFGMIQWTGNAGHTVQIPLSVLPQSL